MMQSLSPPPRTASTVARGNAPQLKILARACRFCRARKTKCDTQKPRCGTCTTHNRQCVYSPSTALLNALQEEKASLERCIIALKGASSEERAQLLDSITVTDGKVRLPDSVFLDRPRECIELEPARVDSQGAREHDDGGGLDSADEDYDASNFLCLDERGQIGIYGPTSALHGSSPMKSGASAESEPSEALRNQLIANAALQRQKEHALARLPTICGESGELAMHLLDLHWNRQHHTFLLTYRPAIMRDLMTGGPYCSDFLLNAIFACVSKFSDRIEVRDNPAEPETAGRRFFIRCEEMLARELSASSIPTLVALLLLGSTFIARGLTSKGWLYTGYALRMVYDLGLHLDCKEVAGNAEEIEIRRRVFWGAFICDKLQSLYLGRPITIQLRDSHVSRNFLDTLEEHELWTPYVDPKSPVPDSIAFTTPIYSVSTFQQLCSLSKIMARIVNRFYVIGATAENTKSHLQSADDALTNWYKNLPSHLIFEPWVESANKLGTAAPNVIILLTTFNALVILVHRPFTFDGHLRPTNIPADSWERCTTAARNITSLASAYQNMYSLRRAPYLLSYAVYVSCTIHTRNTTAESGTRHEDTSALILSLKCLDELTVPNSGVSNPAGIIRRLMAANGIPNTLDSIWDGQTPNSQELDALCRLFPPSTPNFVDFGQPQSWTGLGSYGYDSLRGLMDMYMPSLNGDIFDPKDAPI
ncbi:hypothetical protein K469DRAFT_679128 [Zopfia rhizophila CBS 207.26]|uniref:Zn(2)-C6 fungal-type domain-containing protein n=1 Tax=Zopfia rhizophila CBS 207.26 TaxID=1314779 RepID=A0A6A6D9C3_9PEZI|nr:hypothetical protein K469DRAFT_679128 [Zopfia rhizophila CBS 207.26]